MPPIEQWSVEEWAYASLAVIVFLSILAILIGVVAYLAHAKQLEQEDEDD